MSRLILSVAITACVLLPSPKARAQSTASPTKAESIFDGTSLDGWSGDPRLWSVRDGVIHGETTPETSAKGNTFLIWQGGNLSDFELSLSFRCNATNNSGIQYRSEHIQGKSARNDWSVRGYQHEVRNEIGFPNIAGFIYDERGKRGRICMVGEKAIQEGGKKKVLETLITPEEFKELFNLDGWNKVVIRAEGRRLRHFLNDRLILDFTDSPELARTEGVIALQLHAGKPMWTEFKDIFVEKL